MERLYNLGKKVENERMKNHINFLHRNIGEIDNFNFGNLYDKIVRYIIATMEKFIKLVISGNLPTDRKEYEIDEWNYGIESVLINYKKLGLKGVISFLFSEYNDVNIDEHYQVIDSDEKNENIHIIENTENCITYITEFINSNLELVKSNNINISCKTGKKFTVTILGYAENITFKDMNIDKLCIKGECPFNKDFIDCNGKMKIRFISN